MNEVRSLMDEHIRRMMGIVASWESVCRRQSDEIQQDMTLEIPLISDGERIGVYAVRWNPGWQRGRVEWKPTR